MLVEIVGSSVSIVFRVYDRFANVFKGMVPFTSEAKIWKEEVYFSVPKSLNNLGEPVKVIDYGVVYYWPPEKCLCIFYGVSEPYTDVYPVGEIIGPLSIAWEFTHEERLTVKEHIIDEEYRDVVRILEDLGYSVATPTIHGERYPVASKGIGAPWNRIAMMLSVEDYGVYIESEPLYKHSKDLITLRTTWQLKEMLKGMGLKRARIDINDHGYVCITGVSSNINELPKTIKEVEKAYSIVLSVLRKMPTPI